MKTFEKYLEEDVWEPEGVLDDDMPDAFEAWLAELDTQEVMDYADKYGKRMRWEGMGEVLDGLRPHIEELKKFKDTINDDINTN